MTRVIPPVMLLSALLAFAAPAAAQAPLTGRAPARASSPNAEAALSKRVSLDLKQMAPRDAFKVIADSIGYTAEVAPDVSTPVDILVNNISARTALATICESIGCTWRVSGTVIRVQKGQSEVVTRPVGGMRSATSKPRPPEVSEFRRLMDQVLPADMKFDHAPLADVAARLSKATGLDVSFRETRQDQTLSGDFGGKPFSAALKAISEQIGGQVGIIAGRTGTGTTPSMGILIGARKPPK